MQSALALRRQLQELPGTQDGLSLTERLFLHYLAEAGPVPFGRVFAELMAKRKPLPCLGDMMFHALLRPLIDGERPLLVETAAQGLETSRHWPLASMKKSANERASQESAWSSVDRFLLLVSYLSKRSDDLFQHGSGSFVFAYLPDNPSHTYGHHN